MKKLLTAILIITASVNVFAASNPMVAMGIEGGGGVTSAVHTAGDDAVDWGYGYSYSFGIFFEKFFTRNFLFHSGFGYSHYTINYEIPDLDSKSELDLECLKIPAAFHFMMVKGNFSFGVPLGAAYTSVFRANQTDTLSTGNDSYDYLHAIKVDQLSVYSGLEFRFSTKSAVDFFFGTYGEYFITDIAASGISRSDDNLVSFYGKAGVIFRTF